MRQTFGDLVVHTPARGRPYAAAVDVLDLRLPRAVRAVVGAVRCRVRDGQGGRAHGQHRPYGSRRPPARRWSSTRWDGSGCSRATDTSRPTRPLSRGLEVHPWGAQRRARDLDRPRLRSGRLRLELSRGRDEVRVGRRLVRPASPRQGADRAPGGGPRPRRGALPGQLDPSPLRPAAADGIFFAGDSAGHCLPLTAEGIRTALYFGIACGRELRAVVEGRKTREAALRDYAAFSASHRWKFECDAAGPAPRPEGAAPPACAATARDGAERRSSTGRSGTTCDRAARVRALLPQAAPARKARAGRLDSL